MLNMQTISRLIFLLFIVCFAVYFLFVNKNAKQEHFEQEAMLPKTDKKVVNETINDIYLSKLNRAPTKEEVDFFYVYVSQRDITKDQLTEVIVSSADVVGKSLKNMEPVTYDTKIYGNEQTVIDIFNEILERNPDPKELAHYAKLLATDKSFTIKEFKMLLLSSEENKRLDDLQKNNVYSEIMGGITDRQLTLMITTYYQDVIGTSEIDSDTMKFLKKKLVAFELNELKFKAFLKNFVANDSGDKIDLQATLQESIINQANKLQNKEDKFNAFKNNTEEKLKNKFSEINEKEAKIKKVIQDINGSGSIKNQCYDIDGEQYCMTQQPNKVVIESLLNARKAESDNYLDSSNVLDTIKKQQSTVYNAKCQATDSDYATDKKGSQTMGSLIDDRNTQLLKETCFRNKKFLGVDEDLVLRDDQAWSVPQRHPAVCQGNFNNYQPNVDQTALIGTLIKDSKETNVGSILPFIPPR